MVTYLRKRYFARGSRHDKECYNAVTAGPGIAWLEVDNKRESLLYQAGADASPVRLAEETYIFSPCAAGQHLVWVQREGKEWNLKSVDTADPDPDKVIEPVKTEGRPLSLAACDTGEGALLVWEERQGVRTRVRYCRVTGDGFSPAAGVTDGSFNAYDPAVCRGVDGKNYIAFNAFYRGHYRILLQVINSDGTTVDEPRIISNRNRVCLYPSVCARPEGGIWFSFTCADLDRGAETSLVQHDRYLSQRTLFSGSSRVYAGVYDKGRLYAPLAGAGGNNNQGAGAAMIVFGAEEAGHSRILTGPDRQVHILFRQHTDRSAVSFEQEPVKPLETGGRKPMRTSSEHPGLAMVSLLKDRWTDPVTLVGKAHLEGPVSLVQDDAVLRIAVTEDTRYTGWSNNGEWFDHTGQLGVGEAVIELPRGPGIAYDLRQYTSAPVPYGNIENPAADLPDTDGFFTVLGQTHTHSNLSVCSRMTDRESHVNFRFMQDVQHCAFGACTDHAYNMWHTEMLVVNKLADYYYFPGEFIAFPAYEWTGSNKQFTHEGGPFGHVNPLYLEEEGELEILTPCDPEGDGSSTPRLWKTYRGNNIITPPHHVADLAHGYSWKFFDETFIPVVEMYQDNRGSAEQPGVAGVSNTLRREEGGYWVLDQLKSGKRFGFIAGADHRGISLAGVLVRELTRTALYEGFMARRCFGTSGLRFSAVLTCNGSLMGKDIKANKGQFRIIVTAPEPIDRLEIVRDGETVETVPGNGNECDHSWQAERQRDGEFWYVRVILKNGEMGWTSPVWLDA